MRLPRDVSGRELAVLLERQGYRVVRQAGSHIRMASIVSGTEHHVTIPLHDQLKIGTLSGIISDIAHAMAMDRNELAERLFRK